MKLNEAKREKLTLMQLVCQNADFIIAFRQQYSDIYTDHSCDTLAKMGEKLAKRIAQLRDMQ